MTTRSQRTRLFFPFCLAALALAAVSTTAALATPADEIRLTVTKNPLIPDDVHLSWTGGNPGYTVHRGSIASFDPGPASSIGSTAANAWNDSPPTFDAIFYFISDTRCGPNDTRELTFFDANCDGIDGVIDDGVFVDTVTGNNANPGTLGSPKKTVGAGITAAAASFPVVKDVYISKGTYNEAVTIPTDAGSGIVSLYGGYDASNGWSRSFANTTTIQSPTNPAILAANLTQSSEIQLISVLAPPAGGVNAYGSGNSSTGILVRNSPGGLQLRAVSVTSNAGAQPGPRPNGPDGFFAFNGSNAAGSTGGPGGGSQCGMTGGQGAHGVGGVSAGNFGGVGAGPFGGLGGNGGSAGVCGSADGGAAPLNAQAGAAGAAGSNGASAPTSMGSLDANGIYTPMIGNPGTNGGNGNGGGGGGSGGGTSYASGIFCTLCNALGSGGGGGGGGGGCGGQLGTGGSGGGGSFPVVSVDSQLIIDQCTLHAGPGGFGGLGGNGGIGSPGGNAGGPANGSGGFGGSCAFRAAGAGAPGAAGGAGGRGGGGSGGAGGPSICVLYKGNQPLFGASTCTTATAAFGGQGGMGATQASPGPAGATAIMSLAN